MFGLVWFKSLTFLNFVVLPMDQHQTGIFSFSKAFFALKLSKGVAHFTALPWSCLALKSDDMWMEDHPVEGLQSFAQILWEHKLHVSGLLESRGSCWGIPG